MVWYGVAISVACFAWVFPAAYLPGLLSTNLFRIGVAVIDFMNLQTWLEADKTSWQSVVKSAFQGQRRMGDCEVLELKALGAEMKSKSGK